MESMESHKAGFPPFPHPLEIPAGIPTLPRLRRRLSCIEDRQSPPETRNQSHSHRKGLVNHVPGLKRKGCPGTLRTGGFPELAAGSPIVPRGTISGEWDGFGEVCWKWFYFLGLHLPEIMVFCALLQRMGISPCSTVVRGARWRGFAVAFEGLEDASLSKFSGVGTC